MSDESAPLKTVKKPKEPKILKKLHEKHPELTSIDKATAYEAVRKQSVKNAEKDDENRLISILNKIEDHRINRKKLYSVAEILLSALMAVMSGAQSWDSVEIRAQSLLDVLRLYLPFENGIPSHDTYNRFFARINPEKLECLFDLFLDWMVDEQNLSLDNRRINIDGKRLNGASQAKKQTVHGVTAWDATNQITLRQLCVDCKSNEITAIPLLLSCINIKGCEITIDAMGAQAAIVEKIVKEKGDYLIALKENQKTTFEQAQKLIGSYNPDSSCNKYEAEKGYFREWKVKTFKVTPHRMPTVKKWCGLKTLVSVLSVTTNKKNKATTSEIRLYLSSRQESADYYYEAVKEHWSIERNLHWQLDVSFGEDQSRKAAKCAAENLSRLVKFGINLLNRLTKQACSKKDAAYLAVHKPEIREKVFGHPLRNPDK